MLNRIISKLVKEVGVNVEIICFYECKSLIE